MKASSLGRARTPDPGPLHPWHHTWGLPGEFPAVSKGLALMRGKGGFEGERGVPGHLTGQTGHRLRPPHLRML